MNKLSNKVAVITGGNSGIGFSTAKEFIAQGAKVVITGRQQAAIDEAVRELGGNTTGILADTANLQHTDTLVAKVKALYGKVDVLFINAGVTNFFPVEFATEQQFDQITNINYKGAYFTLSKFIPLLTEGASVILLSSINAGAGAANSSVYAGSKAALNSLVKVAATELAARKIRVNSVSPGPIETPILGKLGLDAATLEGVKGMLRNRVPLKRLGASGEAAKLVAFLASDDSSFITGADYLVDGGISINPVLS